jgi:hypothetical protein
MNVMSMYMKGCAPSSTLSPSRISSQVGSPRYDHRDNGKKTFFPMPSTHTNADDKTQEDQMVGLQQELTQLKMRSDAVLSQLGKDRTSNR